MPSPLNRLLKLAVLTLAVSVGACADGSQVQLLGPSVNPTESLSLADDLEAIANGDSPDLSVRTHEAIIGSEGGSLYVDLHYLYVPAGAVSGPTLFAIELREDHKIGAKLTATKVDKRGRRTGAVNDVGAAGFRKPVYLTFSYRFAADVPEDPHAIKVVEVKNGQLIPQPTYISTYYKTATGTLQHFSDYGLGWPTRNTF